MNQEKRVFLASPHGMCAGVRRALETVEMVLDRFGPPVYVLHEIVHNNFIVNDLRQRGVRFAESLEHGVRNKHLPRFRDAAIASEYAWRFLEDARAHELPAIGTLDELEAIRERRRTMKDGYGLLHKHN